MVKAIGIDIVDVDRIRGAMQNHRFVERILTDAEMERTLTPAYVAGRWAAKEAASKCCQALRNWHDIQVLTGENGSPSILVKSGILQPGEKMMISITHEKGHAAAVAILVLEPS